ncbi:alpha-galactosidase [uncultured Hymenobacter sp.]|uniref:alpha-galactosidase n=1 Tax=uncultured Hymenobacter sp. TaxID=170016 RepID=UPI0035CC8741
MPNRYFNSRRALIRNWNTLVLLHRLGLLVCLLLLGFPARSQRKVPALAECRAERVGDELVLANSQIERRYRWNGGQLLSVSLTDKRTGHSWPLDGQTPDVRLPGPDAPNASAPSSAGTLTVVPHPATPTTPACLQATVTTTLGTLQLKRVFRLYPACPAIACDYYLRGQASGNWQTTATNSGDLRNIENQATEREEQARVTVLDRLALPGPHWQLRAVQFFDITDRTNTLVQETRLTPYRAESRLVGNLLFAEETQTGHGLFALKEAPSSTVQLAYPDYDFSSKIGELQVVGLGLTPADLNPNEWTRGYGVVVGVTSGGELGRLSALRTYQEQVRRHLPGRDEMVLMNTWGDRGQDTRLNETFALNEIRAGKRLGISHFQLDDGWQAGQSSNSAFAGGSLTNIWQNPRYWTPHPERFPKGLAPVVKAGRQQGIEVCLWFNPSADSSYAHWANDADALIRLYRQYGIRTFKIDGVKIPDKRAELNLRRLFDRVMAATDGQAVFNLDVTAGRRFGYHYFNEYGNIFLENRYTDWANYYPHWTLRNLWMLSRYVPPQNLQIEFLNKWRNANKYPPTDSLAPAHYPFPYLVGLTLMAQPLAWLEATRLPGEAFEATALLAEYRRRQADLHAGQIFPIGEEPSGRSWTGFQSVRGREGYFLVLRELNSRVEATLPTYLPPGQQLTCTAVVGQGASFTAVVGAAGQVTFRLPGARSFALYHYAIQ